MNLPTAARPGRSRPGRSTPPRPPNERRRDGERNRAALDPRRDHRRLVDGLHRRQRGQHRAAGDAARLRRRHRRHAVGVERLPSPPRLSDPGRRRPRRPRRPPADFHDRHRPVRPRLDLLRRRADRAGADRRSAGAGGRRGAARAAVPRHHFGDLPEGRPRPRHRHLGGRLLDHDLARPAARRVPRRPPLLARRLLDQHPARRDRALADLRLRAGEQGRGRQGCDRLVGGGDRGARLRRLDLRPYRPLRPECQPRP